MSSIVAALGSLDRDTYTKLALALFVGLPVVSTVLHILRQVRYLVSHYPPPYARYILHAFT